MTGRTKGFTLVELLVVVAILAFLVSILLPTLSKAKHQAKVVICSSNLYHVGRGVVIYMGENDMRYPMYASKDECPVPDNSLFQNNISYILGQPDYYGGVRKDRLLTPYLGESIAHCPLDRGFAPDTPLPDYYLNETFFDVYGSSYLYQSAIRDDSGTCTDFNWLTTAVLWKQGIEDIEHPSSLVMAGDRTLFYYASFTVDISWAEYMQMHDPVDYDTNVVFADGHVTEVVLQPAPDHLENDQYSLLNN